MRHPVYNLEFENTDNVSNIYTDYFKWICQITGLNAELLYPSQKAVENIVPGTQRPPSEVGSG